MGRFLDGWPAARFGKFPDLEAEHGAGAMRAIKQALDPDNIMNPGKTVPLDGG